MPWSIASCSPWTRSRSGSSTTFARRSSSTTRPAAEATRTISWAASPSTATRARSRSRRPAGSGSSDVAESAFARASSSTRNGLPPLRATTAATSSGSGGRPSIAASIALTSGRSKGPSSSRSTRGLRSSSASIRAYGSRTGRAIDAQGDDQKDRRSVDAVDEEAQQVDGAGVGPLDVLDDDQQGLRAGEPAGDDEQRLEEACAVEVTTLPTGGAIAIRRGHGRVDGQLWQESPDQFTRRPNERSDPVCRDLRDERSEGLDERQVGELSALQLEARAADAQPALARGLAGDLVDETRLADAGLTRDDDHAWLARACHVERRPKSGDLGCAPDELPLGAPRHEAIISLRRGLRRGFRRAPWPDAACAVRGRAACESPHSTAPGAGRSRLR